jgi:hypothetical protein
MACYAGRTPPIATTAVLIREHWMSCRARAAAQSTPCLSPAVSHCRCHLDRARQCVLRSAVPLLVMLPVSSGPPYTMDVRCTAPHEATRSLSFSRLMRIRREATDMPGHL